MKLTTRVSRLGTRVCHLVTTDRMTRTVYLDILMGNVSMGALDTRTVPNAVFVREFSYIFILNEIETGSEDLLLAQVVQCTAVV